MGKRQSVYVKPTGSGNYVKPGCGATEYSTLRLEDESSLLRKIEAFLRKEGDYPAPSFQLVFRMLGSPRSWQLQELGFLSQLDPKLLDVLVRGAKIKMGEVSHGEKYVICTEPMGIWDIPGSPERDYTKPKVIEEHFWANTIPVEFIQKVLDLESSGKP